MPARQPDQSRAIRAFTLIELVMAIGLLVALTGAIVFSFSSLQKNQQLNEGVDRLLTLVRYAKAHAATSGTPLRFQLVQIESESAVDSRVQVIWEPDPFNHPGEFVPFAEAAPLSEAVNELVSVQPAVPPGEGDDTGAATTDSVLNDFGLYADGSTDHGKLIITSRDTEDRRRFLFELAGITGELKTRQLNSNEFSHTPEVTY